MTRFPWNTTLYLYFRIGGSSSEFLHTYSEESAEVALYSEPHRFV